jgi:hypothetical protein
LTTKLKSSKRKSEIKMRKAGHKRCHTDGMKECGKPVRRSRYGNTEMDRGFTARTSNTK